MSTPPAAPLELESLPFPVAHPLALARDEGLPPTERLEQALFAGYQALRATGLLLLADYLSNEGADRAVDEAARALRLPHWREWTELADALSSFWRGEAPGKPARPPRFAALAAGWAAARTELAELGAARHARAVRLGAQPADAAEDAATLAACLPRLEAACSALFPAGAFTLLHRATSSPLQVVRVHGPHRDGVFLPEPADASLARALEASPAVAVVEGQPLELSPLFVPSGAEPLVMLDGLPERGTVLLGVKTREEAPQHLAAFKAALARKAPVPLLLREAVTASALVGPARAHARAELAQLSGRVYQPESWVERRDLDRALEDAFDRASSAVLVLGEAGRGKTSVLARKVDALTQPDGTDVVVFLCGRSAWAGEATWSGARLLCQAVLRQAGIAAGSFNELSELLLHLHAAEAEPPQRRVWLVLDGLDEAARFPELLRAVDELLPKLSAFPWVRLLMSCRTGEYAALERRGRVFAHQRHLHPFLDSRENVEKPWLGLRPFDRGEAAAAWQRYAQAQPSRAWSASWVELPEWARELAAHPLHVRLLHDTFAGVSELPPTLDEAGLLRRWTERLCAGNPAARGALERLAQVMVEQARPVLPVERADEWRSEPYERQGLRPVDRVARLDPVEWLVTASPLLRPAREGVGGERQLTGYGFAHARLCEQVLLEDLLKKAVPREELDHEDLAREAEYAALHSGFYDYQEALSSVVVRAAREGNVPVLANLLALPQDVVRHRWVETALRTLGTSWGPAREGREGPRASLAALTAAARRGPRSRERFLSVTGVTTWLEERGHRWGAVAVSAARLECQPDDAGRALAHSGLLARVGSAEKRAGRMAEVRHCYETSLQWRRRIASAAPERLEYQNSLSSALARMAALEEGEGREAQARALYAEGLGIDRKLLGAEPAREDLITHVAVGLTSVADLDERAGRRDQARTLYLEALSLDRALLAAAPEDVERQANLSSRLARLGGVEEASGNVEVARGHYRESLALRRRLAESHPGDPRWADSLLRALDRLGRLEEAQARPDEARTWDEEALQLERKLVTGDASRLSSLSSTLGRLGNLELASGRCAQARAYYEESLALRRRLVAEAPGEAARASSLSRALDRLGVLEESVGQVAEAQRCYEEALAVDRRLSEAAPLDAELTFGLAVSLLRLSKFRLAARDGRPTEELVEAVALARRARASFPTDAQAAELLGDALCSLARCRTGADAAPHWAEGLALLRQAVAGPSRTPEFAADLKEALTHYAATRPGDEAASLRAEAAGLKVQAP
jgi:tetratricopeptide (TPR) repeat protein